MGAWLGAPVMQGTRSAKGQGVWAVAPDASHAQVQGSCTGGSLAGLLLRGPLTPSPGSTPIGLQNPTSACALQTLLCSSLAPCSQSVQTHPCRPNTTLVFHPTPPSTPTFRPNACAHMHNTHSHTHTRAQAEQQEAGEEGGGGGAAEDGSEDEDEFIYNPLKLPLGWDGKPIPYWLYKLHGLNQEFKCEICGNYSYWGRCVGGGGGFGAGSCVERKGALWLSCRRCRGRASLVAVCCSRLHKGGAARSQRHKRP